MRLLMVGLGFLAACESGTPLSDVAVYADMTLQDGELAIEVDAQDVHARPGQTEINDPDLRISVRVRGEEIGLAKYYAEYPYAAKRMLDAPLMADEDVVVILERESGDYAETIATAPPPFALAPPTDARASQPITVSWSPTSQDAMSWRGGCGEYDNGPIPMDTGAVTFPAGVLVTERCGARLTVSRSRVSLPDTELSQARISITQAFSVDFEVAP